MEMHEILGINIEEWQENLDKLRKEMGTLPSEEDDQLLTDRMVVGCKEIEVKLVDWPNNPYRAIFEMAVATWGNKENWMHKWENTTVRGKQAVILAALSRKCLPTCLEAPKFTFAIQGPSRAAFDQFARHRIGVGIASIGTRDNSWRDADLRIPHVVDEDTLGGSFHQAAFTRIKEAYDQMGDMHHSWQAARFILPMGTCHRWVMTVNYRALQDMMWQRLKFCEQFDTVGTAWLMRERIKEKFPLLAAFLRPGCDFVGKCQYHETYSLSELFGCLFAPCGRHPTKEEYTYATFNEACSNIKEIEEDLSIKIPRPRDWDQEVKDGIEKDKKFLEVVL